MGGEVGGGGRLWEEGRERGAAFVSIHLVASPSPSPLIKTEMTDERESHEAVQRANSLRLVMLPDLQHHSHSH